MCLQYLQQLDHKTLDRPYIDAHRARKEREQHDSTDALYLGTSCGSSISLIVIYHPAYSLQLLLMENVTDATVHPSCARDRKHTVLAR